MNSRLLIGLLALTAFAHAETVTLSAIVSLENAPGGAPQNGVLSIQAPTLPANAFFGKDAVIPVEVVAEGQTITSEGLRVEIGYQLVDASGQPIGTLSRAPVQLVRDPKRSNALIGNAIIPRSDLIGLQQGGKLQYFFRAQQATGDTVLTVGGLAQAPAGTSANALPANPFNSAIIQETSSTVRSQGSVVSIPDLSLIDGDSGITLKAGALSSDGTLRVRQLDTAGWPAGPNGAKPLLVLSMELEGSQLVKAAEVTLSYAADAQGKVQGADVTGDNLALYMWDGFAWRLVSRPRIDTTLRTVTATTSRMATFALLASGPTTAASVRPLERILTPNGDGLNDTALFGIEANEDVRIFDIRGRRVRTIPGPNAVWDGHEEDGGIVESGVYIYQYVSQGERVSGVIAVAK